MPRILHRLRIVVLLATVFPAVPAPAQNVPCTDVIAASNRLERERPSKSRDPIYLGRVLHVEAYWAERCLTVYGRRLKRRAPLTTEAREKFDERWERWPPEEFSREEGDAVIPLDELPRNRTRHRRPVLPRKSDGQGR